MIELPSEGCVDFCGELGFIGAGTGGGAGEDVGGARDVQGSLRQTFDMDEPGAERANFLSDLGSKLGRGLLAGERCDPNSHAVLKQGVGRNLAALRRLP